MIPGSADKTAAGGASPRVLVVDDSSVARRQLREALERVGLSVSEAGEPNHPAYASG